MNRIVFSLLVCLSYFGFGYCQDWRTSFSKVTTHINSIQDVADLSNDTAIKITMPDFAYVNIRGVMSLPSSKSTVRNAWMEVYDGNGHYFKKRVVMKAQGAYSLRFPKKNFSIEFSEDDWSLSKTTDVKIGKWVEQASYQFKAFYVEMTRGLGEIGYHIYDDVVADRDPFWLRVGYEKSSKARCYPDGFPFALYFNGQFYGVYAWQLRKSHKNMNQKKTTVNEHIHLDGDIRNTFFFDGNIDWTMFEVRNPKSLYSMTNELYNGDSPRELMDVTSPFFLDTDVESVALDKKRTSVVKQYIVQFSHYCGELAHLDTVGLSPDEFRKEFERRFELQSLIDYYVFYRMTMNSDGRVKNWQWFTYDGMKWLVTPYDLDQILGVNLYGIPTPAFRTHSYIDNGPFPWIDKYYHNDECQRYFDLRDSGVFSPENLKSKVTDWTDRVGEEYYALERQKWPESPCYCEAICNPGWEVCDDWSLLKTVDEYMDYTKYEAGDVCSLEGRLWRATSKVRGERPFVRNSVVDSLERIYNWIDERIEFLDDFYGYSPVSVDMCTQQTEIRSNKIEAIFTLSGVRVAEFQNGVNIVLYADGRREIKIR